MEMPDKLSAQLKLTTALVPKTNPFAFGVGETATVITGGVLSRFTVKDVLTLWPAASVAVPLITWFAPSLLTVRVLGQLTGATPPLQLKDTVTLELFHLLALAVGEAVATIASGAVCTLKIKVAGDDVLPALSIALPLNV